MTVVELESLLDWFVRHKLLPPEPRDYYRDIFRTGCSGLTTEQLRAGCDAVRTKCFVKAPHPLAFKALCLAEWKPAKHDVAKAHLKAMRQACR